MITGLSAYDGQPELRKEFLAAEAAGAFGKGDRPDHLTASAVVLSPDRRQVLLVLHKKVGLWLQPGGHAEAADRSLAQAALREAREETGAPELVLVSDRPVHLDRHRAPCGARWHLDVRFLLTAPAGRVEVSDESSDVRWWPVDALPEPRGSDLEALLAAVAVP